MNPALQERGESRLLALRSYDSLDNLAFKEDVKWENTMKTNLTLLFGIACVVAILGVAVAEEKPDVKPPRKAPAPTVAAQSTNAIAPKDFPVIGYIEKNDREITIKAGPQGTFYSVKTA